MMMMVVVVVVMMMMMMFGGFDAGLVVHETGVRLARAIMYGAGRNGTAVGAVHVPVPGHGAGLVPVRTPAHPTPARAAGRPWALYGAQC